MLAHLADPGAGAALDGVVRVLVLDAALVATVPPIVDDTMMDAQRASGVHRANPRSAARSSRTFGAPRAATEAA